MFTRKSAPQRETGWLVGNLNMWHAQWSKSLLFIDQAGQLHFPGRFKKKKCFLSSIFPFKEAEASTACLFPHPHPNLPPLLNVRLLLIMVPWTLQSAASSDLLVLKILKRQMLPKGERRGKGRNPFTVALLTGCGRWAILVPARKVSLSTNSAPGD